MAETNEGGREIRLFVALGIPDDAARAVAGVQRELQAVEELTARYTPRPNLHLTLKFLGEQPASEVEGIAAELERAVVPGFEAELGELGVFAARGPIRIVWIHLAGAGVVKLQEAVDDALGGRFEAERQFMSHLTIARVKRVQNRQKLIDHLCQIPVPRVSFRVREFHLKQSTLTRAGAQYRSLRAYPLGDTAA